MAENEAWEVQDVIERVNELYDPLLNHLVMTTLYLWKKTWIASQGHKTGCEAYTYM